jgi:hypothetical protein
MMDNDPEIAADQYREEVEKGKQPRERELFAQFAAGRRSETDDERDQQAASPDSQERQQEPVDVSAFENLRSWDSQMIVSHWSYRVCVVSVFAG